MLQPSPRTWIDHEIPPYDEVNQEVYSTLTFLLQRPMIRLRQTTAQSIPNATNTPLTWQTEDIDPYNWHSSTTNPTRITPNIPGWIRGWFSVGFPGTTGGNFRYGYLAKNGGSSTRSRHDSKPTAGGLAKRIAGVPFWLAMNGTTDYFEVNVFQDSGSAMLTTIGANACCEFFARYWTPL